MKVVKIPNKRNIKKTTPKHICIKLLKSNDKEKIFKTTRKT